MLTHIIIWWWTVDHKDGWRIMLLEIALWQLMLDQASPWGSVEAIASIRCAATVPLRDSSHNVLLANIQDDTLVRIDCSYQMGLMWHSNQHPDVLWFYTHTHTQKFCEIWGFFNGDRNKYCLLGCQLYWCFRGMCRFLWNVSNIYQSNGVAPQKIVFFMGPCLC